MSALLFNSIQFDQATNLYTYNYAVENNTSGTISEVDILVGDRALGTFPDHAVQPLVPAYTAPVGWTMYGAFSGSIASAPYNENGGFYEWYGNGSSIAPGANVFGFSVTTSFAPTLSQGLNNFFLYGSEGVTSFGNVAVPSGANWLMAEISSPPSDYHSAPAPSLGEGLSGLMVIVFFVYWLARNSLRRNHDDAIQQR